MPPKKARQTLMFSATFPRDIQLLAADFLVDYLFLTVGRVGAASGNITQTVLLVEEPQKLDELIRILGEKKIERTLVFAQTKRGVDVLDNQLRQRKFPVTSIHGDLKQWEREEALKDFKSGKCVKFIFSLTLLSLFSLSFSWSLSTIMPSTCLS